MKTCVGFCARVCVGIPEITWFPRRPVESSATHGALTSLAPVAKVSFWRRRPVYIMRGFPKFLSFWEDMYLSALSPGHCLGGRVLL
jgi:hypothetical protein